MFFNKKLNHLLFYTTCFWGFLKLKQPRFLIIKCFIFYSIEELDAQCQRRRRRRGRPLQGWTLPKR
jgi:hypothetical protein